MMSAARDPTLIQSRMAQIEKCKLGIREAVKECEISSGDRQILARHFDEDGEIDQKWIFCAKCCEAESYEVSCKPTLQPNPALKPVYWTSGLLLLPRACCNTSPMHGG